MSYPLGEIETLPSDQLLLQIGRLESKMLPKQSSSEALEGMSR
jgi:hypothetical protein